MDTRQMRGAVEAFYGNMPHPQYPRVKVKDYPSFLRVAGLLKQGVPDASDVAHAHEMLQQTQMSPSDFEHAWKIARPLSHRLLGRDPTMSEIQQLHQAHPQEYMDYYGSHPHPQYPEVRAADMARYHHAATPYALKHEGREPNAREVARFALGGYSADEIERHYADRI